VSFRPTYAVCRERGYVSEEDCATDPVESLFYLAEPDPALVSHLGQTGQRAAAYLAQEFILRRLTHKGKDRK